MLEEHDLFELLLSVLSYPKVKPSDTELDVHETEAGTRKSREFGNHDMGILKGNKCSRGECSEYKTHEGWNVVQPQVVDWENNVSKEG